MSEPVPEAVETHTEREPAPRRPDGGFDVNAAAALLRSQLAGPATDLAGEPEDHALPVPLDPGALDPAALGAAGAADDAVEEVSADDIVTEATDDDIVVTDPIPDDAVEAALGDVDVPSGTAIDVVPASLSATALDAVTGPARRVVVHTTEGVARRALLDEADLDGEELRLSGAGGELVEAIPARSVKAVFFMLEPGEAAPEADGQPLRVTFHDGRQIAGASRDYRPGAASFFLVPVDGRTRTARVWIPCAAARSITAG